MYKDIQLFIDGEWVDADDYRTIEVINPATEEKIFTVARAGSHDLDRALKAAEVGFETWRRTSAIERSRVLRKAGDLLRIRLNDVAVLMTAEQGKPLVEARAETKAAIETIEWFAEEARRTYGRVVPPRGEGILQLVIKEPVGVVAAFTPWNFPINQAVRKISAALAAGCSVILKGPEETPASCAALVQAFADAGVPPGAINLVFGSPSEISQYLIPHPTVRKISFTGSTVVGKQLAALAGLHMKRITMELGGHAPAIVFGDADIDTAAQLLSAAKFRNAGQVCVAPTRFLVQESVYEDFVAKFVALAKAINVGNGVEEKSTMGPLANDRRIDAVDTLVVDAVQKGATLRTGGRRLGNKGYFYEPTVLTDVPIDALVMNEEPFGPIATIAPFDTLKAAMHEANRLPYGLASYAFTQSNKTITALSANVEAGMLTINHLGLALPEAPFGGVKDSGYGSEGGTEAIETYLNTKFVTAA